MSGPSPAPPFDYRNRNDRPPGRLARWGSVVSRGVRAVQAQVPAYAEQWESHNRAVVAATASDGAPLWVVLGDSMAQGIGASAYDRGWPGQLVDQVPDLADLRMLNLSFYGAGVADVVERQWPAAADLAPTLGEPALVTVVIGSNDLFDRDRRAGLPEHLRRMLDLLPAGSVVASQPGHRAASLAFNELVEARAAERDLVVADFSDPRTIDWRGKLSPDHFHPSDRGYAAMAQVLAPAVRQALSRQSRQGQQRRRRRPGRPPAADPS